MDFLQITSILIVLAAAFGAINYLFFKLPSEIGILVVSLLASIGIVVIDALLPDMEIENTVRTTATGVDFSQALLEGPEGFIEAFANLYRDVADCLQSGQINRTVPGIADGLAGMSFIQACQISHENDGQWTPLA